jgi:hypothetical protein
MHPDPRMLLARIARIERQLGIDPAGLSQGLDPPDTW